MVERFLKQTTFSSREDFLQNYEIKIPENFNFGYDVIDAYAEEQPEKKAICWTNDKGEHIDFTYKILKDLSDRTASYFQSLGIKKGDMVMLILKRRYEWWLSMIALCKIGAIAIPATHLLTEQDIIYRCNAANIKAIVCVGNDVIVEHVKKALPQSKSVEHIISVGPDVPEGWDDFHRGIENAKPFVRPEHVNKNEDIMLLYFTSGTTGEPKMVIHNFEYPLGHISTGYIWHHLDDTSLHLTMADTGWGKAVWGKLYGQMIAGACLFVFDHEKFNPSSLLSMISKYKVTSFCAPPTVFRFMIREDLSKFDLSALKSCCIAGEALNPSVYKEFYRLTGIKLREAFGQTETTAVIMTDPWLEPKPGSMGKPSPQYDVDIVDVNGNSVDVGEPGDIVIRTDKGMPIGLFMGYYKNEEKTKEVWHDGRYYTGDVAWRDEDGYYWYVGRNDDVIKSSGYRIGPFEVESAVMTHKAVVECAITGVPDPVRGQVVKATIVLAKEYKDRANDDLKKEIQDHVKRTTAPYKYPRVIEFVDELPKTISGKIKRVTIRQNDKGLD